MKDGRMDHDRMVKHALYDKAMLGDCVGLRQEGLISNFGGTVFSIKFNRPKTADKTWGKT